MFKDVAAAYASESNPEWKALTSRTREIYIQAIAWLDRFDLMRVDEITRPMVIQYRDDTYDKPAKCRLGLVVLSNILRYAHDRGMVEYNQAALVKGLPKKKEIEPWTEEQFEKFIETAPRRLRTAVMLALYTGQRRSDLIRMLWTDYNGQTIKVVQQKTRKFLEIPVHVRLKRELETLPLRKRTILVNAFGEKWDGESLRRAVKKHAIDVGLPETLSIHGLRKSAAIALAEAGCTPHQIAAVTGHQSLKNVELYTRAADQRRLAKEAMDSWK